MMTFAATVLSTLGEFSTLIVYSFSFGKLSRLSKLQKGRFPFYGEAALDI